MDVTKMMPHELGEQMQAIVAGELKGEEAAQVLRAAVEIYNERKESIENLDACIRQAETALIYGPAGRPSRNFGSSWGTSTAKVFAEHEIAKVFSESRAYDECGMPISSPS